MTSLTQAQEERLAFSLAFVGGYGDAAGFVLAKTFTGHVTGNFVLAAVSAAARDWRTTLERLLAIVSFLAGVLLSVVLARLLAARPASALALISAAIAIEVILILIGYIALIPHAAMRTELFVVCLSLALGLQNGAFRRAGGVSVHTTYLTGMITGLMVNVAEKFHSEVAARAPGTPDPGIRLIVGIWIIFFLGAAAGAGMIFRFKEAGLLGLAFILFALIIFSSITAWRHI